MQSQEAAAMSTLDRRAPMVTQLSKSPGRHTGEETPGCHSRGWGDPRVPLMRPDLFTKIIPYASREDEYCDVVGACSLKVTKLQARKVILN